MIPLFFRRLPILGVLLSLLIGTASAAIEAGAKPKDYPPDSGKHVVTIRREAENDLQKKMIAAAEAALPGREALREALGGNDPAAAQWWHEEALGIRIPFAITGAAVDYYKNLVEGYGKQTFKNRYIQPSSAFEYHAAAAFHAKFEFQGDKFSDVHVVTLKLSFSQNFAATTTEGCSFSKERTVILDADGKVLRIAGDGPTEAPIMAI